MSISSIIAIYAGIIFPNKEFRQMHFGKIDYENTKFNIFHLDERYARKKTVIEIIHTQFNPENILRLLVFSSYEIGKIYQGTLILLGKKDKSEFAKKFLIKQGFLAENIEISNASKS